MGSISHEKHSADSHLLNASLVNRERAESDDFVVVGLWMPRQDLFKLLGQTGSELFWRQADWFTIHNPPQLRVFGSGYTAYHGPILRVDYPLDIGPVEVCHFIVDLPRCISSGVMTCTDGTGVWCLV